MDKSGTLVQISNNVRSGLMELRDAYPAMLSRLRETLLAELQVPNASASLLEELRARAENVRQLSGDHRLESFVVRLSHFDGSEQDMESLASMATNKPASIWVDADIDRTVVTLAEMAQSFIHLESYAHVKGRSDKRHAMAVTVGLNGSQRSTVQDAFRRDRFGSFREVDQLDRADCKERWRRCGTQERRNIILAALAELSARFLSAPAERRQLT